MADYKFTQTGAQIQAILNRKLYKRVFNLTISYGGNTGALYMELLTTTNQPLTNVSDFISYLKSYTDAQDANISVATGDINNVYFNRVAKRFINGSTDIYAFGDNLQFILDSTSIVSIDETILEVY